MINNRYFNDGNFDIRSCRLINSVFQVSSVIDPGSVVTLFSFCPLRLQVIRRQHL